MLVVPFYGLLLLLGGVGLFLYALGTCPDNIKRYLGKGGKAFLFGLGAKKSTSLLFGLFLSIMMQSSAAASSFVVGLVEVGLLASERALLVIMGASVGTGLVVYFLSLDVILFSPLVFAVIVFWGRFARGHLREYLKICEGIAMVFFGMALIKFGSYPLVNSDFVKNLLYILTGSSVLMAITAYVITSIVQSSTATLAIAIGMASSGLLPFNSILPLILGAYVGSSTSALLAALGKKRRSQGLAWSAFLYRALGIIPMIPLGLLYLRLCRNLPVTIDDHIAILQILLVSVNMIVFLPFSLELSRMGERLASLSGRESIEPLYLDWSFVDMTPIAVSLLSKEIVRTSNFLEEFLYGLFYGEVKSDRLHLLRTSLPDLVNACVFYRSAITLRSNEDPFLARELITTSYSLNALNNMVTLATERLFPLMEDGENRDHFPALDEWDIVVSLFLNILKSSLGAYALDDTYFANRAFKLYGQLSDMLGKIRNKLMLSHYAIKNGTDILNLLTLLDAFSKESLEFARSARRHNAEGFVSLEGGDQD